MNILRRLIRHIFTSPTHCDACGHWHAMVEECGDAVARLAAERDALRAAEPVAWLCEDLIFEGESNVVTNKAHAEARAARPDDWRVTPLYARPSNNSTSDQKAVG